MTEAFIITQTTEFQDFNFSKGTSRIPWSTIDFPVSCFSRPARRGSLHFNKSFPHTHTQTLTLCTPCTPTNQQARSDKPGHRPASLPCYVYNHSKQEERRIEFQTLRQIGWQIKTDWTSDRMPDRLSNQMPEKCQIEYDRMPDDMSRDLPDKLSEYTLGCQNIYQIKVYKSVR